MSITRALSHIISEDRISFWLRQIVRATSCGVLLWMLFDLGAYISRTGLSLSSWLYFLALTIGFIEIASSVRRRA